jgi:hypothetical protein
MDPLTELKAIHLPEQVHNYPIAYGWWILLFAVLSLSLWLLRKHLNYRRRCQAKKQAIKNIKDGQLTTEELISTIKWAALQYFPRQQIASLTGESLQNFLSSCLPIKKQEKFIGLITPILAKRYQPSQQDESATELSEAAILWLMNALPPTQKTLDMHYSESSKRHNINGTSS